VTLLAAVRWVIPLLWAQQGPLGVLTRSCGLRTLTGIPCPFCGGTRAAVLASHGAVLEAVGMNASAAVLVMACPLVAAWLGLRAATGRDLGLDAVLSWLARATTIRALAMVVAVQWIVNIVVHRLG
jgi:hypothetical protein